MGHLIIAGKEQGDLGPKFRNWHETGWDATFEGLVDGANPIYGRTPGRGASGANAKNTGLRRYSTRPALRRQNLNPTLDGAQAVIRKFVLHHDGVSSSQVCWNVLQNERGLSCHFLIDNDGTIFQTLDLALMGFHAAKYNVDSIGVEFCNRGILDRPDYYAGSPNPHPISDEYAINGHKMRSFDFTEAQYESFYELAQLLVKALPNLALEYPRDPGLPTQAAWGTLGPVDALGDSFPASSFAGFLGHYHLTTRKWDPGPFDFKKWIDKLRGRRVFPVKVAGAIVGGDGDGRPVIPDDPKALAAAVQPYYDANELTAAGGFFPVGPWGGTRLWHGGVHLPAPERSPVYAPLAGRIIAARMGQTTPIGSNNFVLMRHDLSVASQAVRVYSLYMHLADEAGAADAPGWMAAPSTDLDGSVSVKGYDVVADAGTVIGHVGTVGPDGLSAPQIHFEIFSTRRWFEARADDPAATSSPFTLIDGSATGRFCEDPHLDELIDRDRDGRLSRVELADFYGAGDKAQVRDLITLHTTEWIAEPDWAESLKAAASQFRRGSGPRGRVTKLDKDDDDYDIDAMVEEQLVPFLWWTDEVARQLGLPANGIVYHYHPLRFIEYANASHAPVGAAVTPTERAIDDNEDTAGDFGYVAEPPPPPPDLHLKLENLVDGYDGDVPPP
ncbi:MAG: N-acetylmuramoyl-L-alanine amidase [Kofleriaceae bacterium]